MTKFDHYKDVIFPDKHTQQQLLEAIKYYEYDATTFDDAYALLFLKVDSVHLQYILAPFLRALAIKQLRERQTIRTREINKNYSVLWVKESVHAPDINTFLDKQSENAVYGSDYEAIALAEVLDVGFACTLVDPKTLEPILSTAIYHQTQTNNASVVHLYNTPGHHFFVIEKDPRSAEGDGNCLYNSFALFLGQFILEENKKEIAAYAEQQKIYAKICNLKPMSLATLFNKVRENISAGEESDHAAAVNLAASELTPVSASLFLQIMSHPAVKVIGLVLLVAGLLALSIGVACFFPATTALTGIALSYSVATTLTMAASGSILAGGMISFFNQRADKLKRSPDQSGLNNFSI